MEEAEVSQVLVKSLPVSSQGLKLPESNSTLVIIDDSTPVNPVDVKFQCVKFHVGVTTDVTCVTIHDGHSYYRTSKLKNSPVDHSLHQRHLEAQERNLQLLPSLYP